MRTVNDSEQGIYGQQVERNGTTVKVYYKNTLQKIATLVCVKAVDLVITWLSWALNTCFFQSLTILLQENPICHC